MVDGVDPYALPKTFKGIGAVIVIKYEHMKVLPATKIFMAGFVLLLFAFH